MAVGWVLLARRCWLAAGWLLLAAHAPAGIEGPPGDDDGNPAAVQLRSSLTSICVAVIVFMALYAYKGIR